MAIKRLPATGDAPRSTGIPQSVVPGGAGDSAGFPWQGRTFEHHGSDFADDDGETPAAFAAAIAAVRSAAAAGDADGLAAATADAICALSQIRVLIPLLAEAGDVGLTPEGRTVEKTQELSIVTVEAPDGRRVMPAFSSVEAMRLWNPSARPIPVPAPQAALAAAQEGTDLIIVNPGSEALEFGVRRTQLQPLALGERVLPAWGDPVVREAFRAALASDPRIVDVELLPGDPQARLLTPETDAVVRIAPGLERDELARLIDWVQGRWAASEVIASRVDSLRMLPRQAG